jgi:hypothetical protein
MFTLRQAKKQAAQLSAMSQAKSWLVHSSHQLMVWASQPVCGYSFQISTPVYA